jgi:very-short-patch-repair endonuclease
VRALQAAVEQLPSRSRVREEAGAVADRRAREGGSVNRWEQSYSRSRWWPVDGLEREVVFSPPSTDEEEAVAAASRLIGAHAAHSAVLAVDVAASACESPIETAMVYGLAAAARNYFDTICFGSEAALPSYDPFVLRITPQAQLGRYRVDFLLTAYAPERLVHERAEWTWREQGLVVECDGHDFHERTKAQARRDKARDRALQALGFQVYRYTGSEIWADVFGCADEATSDLFERILR